MPAAPKYPGVFVEEIPGGVRTIIGVATSIAAFVGRAAKGPPDNPVTITSFDDFVRNFGKLSLDYPLGFAVRDFYLNGGAQAIIVRIYRAQPAPPAAPVPPAAPPATPPVTASLAELDAKGLALEAASPGDWGNTLRVRVTNTDATKLTEVAKALGVLPVDLFDLAIHDTATGVTEQFMNLTATKPSARHVTGVLLNQSAFVRTKAGCTPTDPTGSNADPAAGKDFWEDDTASSASVAAAASQQLTEAGHFGDIETGLGMYSLAKADSFNLLSIPPDTLGGEIPKALHSAAAAFCNVHRAMYIVDPRNTWNKPADVLDATNGANWLNISGENARNAALYFPRITEANPLRGGLPENFAPSGAVAGIIARTDVARGVWKAPSGVDASLTGVLGLSLNLNDAENGLLNRGAINCIRSFPVIGKVVWGARTMRGADVLVDEYKYVPVRRLALYIEASLFRGLKWVVFEPNGERLWGQIRLEAGAFMQGLFREGAFQGSSSQNAYFVKCDQETTTQNDINLGIVNIEVGFAPLKPAEFVVLRIQQIAGQVQT
ncbi:MAG: phage tail sheath subtilisin-like domain-containing protein [Gemmatimonadaceae bacterium]